MGTVGLNFGSPTSGAGFDVSTTVAALVSNLQNIETPWKNQLTTLQGEDTVISNLGTLFSTVSTDISQLTDFQGVLAQKTGSSSDTSVLELTSASSSAVAGTHTVVVNNLAQTSSGYLAPITDASDTLSGSITLQVGTGTAQTINVSNLSNQTLAGLAAAINSSGANIDASVLTDSSGSRLSLVSATSGGSGNITVTANSIADVTTSNAALAYTSSVSGKDASLTVDGVGLTSASNTVTNLIPGLTFQLLAPSPQESGGSPEQVQVVIANDNSGVESAVNQLVTDYNSLIGAVTAQEGNTSSGTAEPLFGSPTISLLQQQLMNSLNAQNPSGSLDSVSTAPGTTLSGSMSIQVGSKSAQSIVIGAAPVPPAANTIYTGSASGDNTLSGLVNAINSADMGVTAGIVTSNGESTLTLSSATAGSAGALTVTSALASSTPAAVGYIDSGGYTTYSADNGTLGNLSAAGDTLSGSLTIQVGAGNPQTVTLDSSDNTLTGLMNAIKGLSGVSATLNEAGTGLTLTSATDGATGALTVTSNLYDESNPTSANLNYTASSDIGSLTSLGISLDNDGTMTFDESTLDSLLNSDFSGVVGFFQSVDSWGQSVSAMLTDSGSSSSTGILALAAQSNSDVETSLNAKITSENSQISTQQTKLTTELNQANEILQELPSQLDSINELYSAITGYNQSSNG